MKKLFFLAIASMALCVVSCKQNNNSNPVTNNSMDSADCCIDTMSCDISESIQGSTCADCDGTGEIVCPKCKGKGITGYYEGEGGERDFWGCKKCGGRQGGSYIDSDGYPNYKAPKKGSGKIKCPTCNGTGE